VNRKVKIRTNVIGRITLIAGIFFPALVFFIKEFYHKGLRIRKGKKSAHLFNGSPGLDSAGKESISHANDFLDIPLIGRDPEGCPLRGNQRLNRDDL
jgi:hypothetical protein